MPTPRLPVPGSDAGRWGDILNEFLLVAHTQTGTLNDDSVGSSQLQDDAVTAASIQDGTVTKANLVSDVQTSLDKADAAIPITEKGAASGVATLDGTSRLTSGQLPTSVGVKSETKAVVNHGATAGTARPSGYGSVEWIGSVEPTNAINGDTWIDTST